MGRRHRSSKSSDVAKEGSRGRDSVKTLGKQYMKARLARAGTSGAKRIGIDEISIKKSPIYRIVVSDLDRSRAIWSGGADRSEASMAQFCTCLDEKNRKSLSVRSVATAARPERGAFSGTGAPRSNGSVSSLTRSMPK